MKYILLTGGLGFIGSHTFVEFSKYDDVELVIIDNFYNSDKKVIDNLEQLVFPKKVIVHDGDVLDKQFLESVFGKYKFDCVIHFAALKAVGESIEKPLLYYDNNVSGTISLLETMEKFNVKSLVFSSSATVYGSSHKSPLLENMQTGVGITNPYGRSKFIIEEMLKDLKGWNITILRYFNPIGAHESGLIGENPKGLPNNLFPYVLRVAKNKVSETNNSSYDYLSVFGNDYETEDGTCLRDYIHVVDLAKSHVKAFYNIGNGLNIYNIGTGKGTSVFELINTFESVNKIIVPIKIVPRRQGDLSIVFCDSTKAKDELGWQAEKNIEDMCKDGWNFIMKQI